MKTIIVTGAGGPAGRALIQQFAAKNAKSTEYVIVGLDMLDFNNPDVTVSAVVPPARSLDFLPVLREHIGFYRADLVIPTVSEELPVFATAGHLIGTDPMSSSRQDIRSHGAAARAALAWTPVPTVIAGSTSVSTANDKLLTMWALDDAGLPIPRYERASTFRNTTDALHFMGGPLVVKPRVSRGGRGVIVVENPSDVTWSELPDDQIVQQFAPGTEYSPQVFRSPITGQSEVVVLEKTGLSDGRVGNATSVRRCTAAESGEIAYLASAVAAALDLTGPVDMDIRLDESGKPVVLEVNARFGANSAHAPALLDHVLADYLPA